jgi:xanthine dehydrogenase large subunit
MLALSAFAAVTDAVAAAGEYRVFPRLDAPATAERILMAVAQVRQKRARLVKTKVRG